MKIFESTGGQVPWADKGLAIIGAITAGFTLSDVSTGVGIAVGLVTICMIVPRAILNWKELSTARRKNRK